MVPTNKMANDSGLDVSCVHRGIVSRRTLRISGPARYALISKPTRPPAPLHAIVIWPELRKKLAARVRLAIIRLRDGER